MGAGFVDEGREQRLLVGVPGRAEQEGAVNAFESCLQAGAADEIDLYLARRRGRAAGDLADLLALGSELAGEFGADGAAGTDHENLRHGGVCLRVTMAP